MHIFLKVDQNYLVEATGIYGKSVSVRQVPAQQPGVVYHSRADFLNKDEYAMYVRGNIAPGMLVRCCKTYEVVYEGDVGQVIKIDSEGLHDLNVFVAWQHRNDTYWVRFIHVELLGFPPSSRHWPRGSKTTPAQAATAQALGSTSTSVPAATTSSVVSAGSSSATSGTSTTAVASAPVAVAVAAAGALRSPESTPERSDRPDCASCHRSTGGAARYACHQCRNFCLCEACFHVLSRSFHRHQLLRVNDGGR